MAEIYGLTKRLGGCPAHIQISALSSGGLVIYCPKKGDWSVILYEDVNYLTLVGLQGAHNDNCSGPTKEGTDAQGEVQR